MYNVIDEFLIFCQKTDLSRNFASSFTTILVQVIVVDMRKVMQNLLSAVHAC